MFARNYAFIERTLELLNELRQQPRRRRLLALEIQERLIVGITRAERNLRRNKATVVNLRRELRTPGGSREQSTRLKDRIAQLGQASEDQQALVRLYRDIGDALAFIYFDRYDLKQLSQNQRSGALTGKSGNRLERAILRRIFKANHIAILNDLTNSLRRGDLTLALKYRFFLIIEAKSGRGGNRARQHRQAEALADIGNYLRTDRREWKGGTVVRQALSERPRYHWRKFNRLVRDFRDGDVGYRMINPEPGLIYIAVRDTDAMAAAIKAVGPLKCGFVFFVNDVKGVGAAYEPLPLIFESASDLIAFYRGEFVVLIIVDFAVVAQAAPTGAIVRYGTSDDWPLEVIASGDEPEEERTHKIGAHFLGRIAGDLVSAKWILRHALSPISAETLALMEGTTELAVEETL